MKTLLTRCWLATAALTGALALTAPTALAQVAEEDDRLGETIRTEAEAMMALIDAIDAAIESGDAKISDTVKAKWVNGRASWKAVVELAAKKSYGPAFKAARDARKHTREPIREVLKAKPTGPVTDALRAYVDVQKPRVVALKRQAQNYPLTDDAREGWLVGEAMFKDAQKSAKKKRWDTAFREIDDCLRELDKVVYETYPSSR